MPNPRVDEGHHRVSAAGFKYLEITEEEWGAFMDDLRQTLNKFDVPPPEQDELKAIIEPTHDAIVISPLQSAAP